MKANEALSELRAAAVAFLNVTDYKQAQQTETFAYRITVYKAPNVRTSEITLDNVHLGDVKAYTYFALNGEQFYAFKVEIWTNDLARRLFHVDSEKVGIDNALKALTDFLIKQ